VNREVFLRELRRLTVQTGTKRLLLVDDNEVSRYILRDLLNQPWLDVHEAANGSEAMASLSEGLPDGLILDLLMPDISGFEILRRLRASPATESLPVLIYTSKVLSEPERAELDSFGVRIVRKEDVTTRLSVQPFLDWVKSVGLAPENVT
jgi:CheY-like chemotaxis protein